MQGRPTERPGMEGPALGLLGVGHQQAALHEPSHPVDATSVDAGLACAGLGIESRLSVCARTWGRGITSSRA